MEGGGRVYRCPSPSFAPVGMQCVREDKLTKVCTRWPVIHGRVVLVPCKKKIPKIREKVLRHCWDGGLIKSKNKYFFELYMAQAFFCPMSQNFNTTRSGDSSLVGHPNVHCVSKNYVSRVFRIKRSISTSCRSSHVKKAYCNFLNNSLCLSWFHIFDENVFFEHIKNF